MKNSAKNDYQYEVVMNGYVVRGWDYEDYGLQNLAPYTTAPLLASASPFDSYIVVGANFVNPYTPNGLKPQVFLPQETVTVSCPQLKVIAAPELEQSKPAECDAVSKCSVELKLTNPVDYQEVKIRQSPANHPEYSKDKYDIKTSAPATL